MHRGDNVWYVQAGKLLRVLDNGDALVSFPFQTRPTQVGRGMWFAARAEAIRYASMQNSSLSTEDAPNTGDFGG